MSNLKKIKFPNTLVDSIEVQKITLGENPKEDLHAATKQYVDTAVSSGVGSIVETAITITDKSSNIDTDDLVYVVTNLVESGTKGHEITATYTGLPTKTYVDKMATGTVEYLGTVSALPEQSDIIGSGDFYRVSAEFTFGSEKAHVGDLLIATKDNPTKNTTDWDLIHTEVDSNTWVANTKDAAGYVSAPGSNNANKVWKTNASGEPAWRDDTNTAHTHEAGTGLELDTTSGYGTGGTTGKVKYSVKYGDQAGTACQGNDSRLSDSRTPTSHTHGNIINDGTLATANAVVVTDNNKKILASTSITTTELGYLDGVTSNVQTQLNGKQATVTGGATSITSSNLTASRALVSDSSGKVAVSAVTATELGYLDGVTSSIQAQITTAATTVTSKGTGSGATYYVTGSSAYTDKTETLTKTSFVSFTGNGAFTAYSFNATSDARLKENFEPLIIEKSILDLPTYKFDFIDGLRKQIGCKAQDLQEICPEIVTENEDGYLSIQESKIVYLLLEEIKKLKKEINELKAR